MTRIAYTSDIHLEFGDKNLPNKDNVDLLILAGDISTPHQWSYNHDGYVRKQATVQKDFFKRIADEFPQTIYIPGNHEHYRGDVALTVELLQKEMPSNIFVGDYLTAQFNTFSIVATTLWTDFNKGNPMDLLYANAGMNDFRLCRFNGQPFTAEDALYLHNKAKAKMEEDLPKLAGKKIVVSHHLPSYQAIAAGFRDSRLNGAYASDLDDFMDKHKIDYWIHGHSHPPLDMMVGSTRLLRNPRGYVDHEHSQEEDESKTYKFFDI